ncbi:MAG: hypothetical protein J7647_18545 [Cyanobacteria bacterium SBLK]|nr:hypothetical protein [Cyanobacteria bacterium SBLK]
MRNLQLLPGAIDEISSSISKTGILTVSDRYGLMAAALDETLGDRDRQTVNRILRAVGRGKIKVTL